VSISDGGGVLLSRHNLHTIFCEPALTGAVFPADPLPLGAAGGAAPCVADSAVVIANPVRVKMKSIMI
jgi:hypothetical protein